MTEEHYTLAEIVVACWKDDSLKARFMSDPKAVLSERGVEVPDGLDVKVVENTAEHVHITLPPAPANTNDLSNEELSSAAGGSPWDLMNRIRTWDLHHGD